AGAFELVAQDFAYIGIIFDDEYPGHSHSLAILCLPALPRTNTRRPQGFTPIRKRRNPRRTSLWSKIAIWTYSLRLNTEESMPKGYKAMLDEAMAEIVTLTPGQAA